MRGELMVVPIVTAPIPLATAAALRTLFAIGNQVPCSGDIFNVPGTITCSGEISDELRETADGVIANLTLFEVGTTLAYTPLTTIFPLTGAVSPDGGGDPTIYVTTPEGPYPGDLETSIDTFDGVPLTQGVPVVSTVPEISWLSVPLAAGWITGSMTVQVLADGPDASYANPNSSQARIYHVRGGVDIAGPFATNYGAAYLGGELLQLTTTSAVILQVEDGDRLRVEIWSQITLLAPVDSGDRQTIYFGTNPPNDPGSILTVGGTVTAL